MKEGLEWICKGCQWCCRNENVPIPGGVDYAYLYWVKGHRVYWEPLSHEWYWLADSKCQYISKYGCDIYEGRPELCRRWFCPWMAWTQTRYEILCKAGNNIMKQIHKREIAFKIGGINDKK